jgi:hypothetical protein
MLMNLATFSTRMNTSMRNIVLCTGLALLLAADAFAATEYQYVAGAANYNLSPGGSQLVPIYLQETVTGGTSLIFSEQGLFGAGFEVDRLLSLPSSPAHITSATANTADFTGATSVGSTASRGDVTEELPLTGFTSGPTGTTSATSTIGKVFLGDVNITAGNTVGQTTIFDVGPFLINNQLVGGNTVTDTNSYDLDFSSLSPTFTGATGSAFSVNVVPEPTSGALAVAGGMALVAGLLRRKRRQAVA